MPGVDELRQPRTRAACAPRLKRVCLHTLALPMATFRILRTDYQADPSSLISDGLLIGRAAVCELQLNHPSVQPFHAGITWHNDAYWLSALAAPSPLLNGEPVKHAPLGDGDVLQLGAYRLRCTVNTEALQISVEFLLEPEPASEAATIAAPEEAEPAEAQALHDYWAQRLPAAAAAQTTSPAAPEFAWEPPGDLRRRWPWSLVVGTSLLTTIVTLVAILAYPRVLAPAALSAAHTRSVLTGAPASAARPSGGSCTSCHALIGSMQRNCAACHTTSTFQPGIGSAHLKAGLTCLSCHAEHRGSAFQPALVANETCTNCHQANNPAPLAKSETANSPHPVAVRYPVKNGLWSWDGLSQAEWQRRALPKHTADYNLREQFHLLHLQGRLQGRAQCGDCHLGGTEKTQLWQNVRESCAQCHRLHPELAAELERLAATNSLKEGNVRCIACHAQHGAEKDLRASTRK